MSLRSLTRIVQQRVSTSYRELAAGLRVVRRTAPTTMEASVYEPIVCLILQGAKTTTVAGQSFTVRAGQSVIVSHPLPVGARITHASADAPFLSLVTPIDLSELRSLQHELDHPLRESEPARPYAITPVDAPTLAVFERYAALAGAPDDVRVLVPLIRRELHYRLLKADNGGMLRALLHRDSHASAIANAIRVLRADFRQAFDVAGLAQSVGMSASSFYKHFKVVTSTTPLQYQKELRLTEARRLLLGGRHSVSTAAYEVGYESPSQFSREYSRKFGAPPRSDLPRSAPSA
ncbi:MAG: AraC family transcriptional regulator [Myxococcota bacterium]